VEVALEPPARGVAGLDDPRPRVAQLLDLGAELRLQPLVLERQTGGARDGGEEARVLVQRRSWTRAAMRRPPRSSTVTVRPASARTSTGRPSIPTQLSDSGIQ
jgi:hypothetical protein